MPVHLDVDNKARLYKVATKKEATVQEMLHSSNNDWDFSFKRPLKEAAITDVAHLLTLLPVIIQGSGEDGRVWSAGTKGFSVSECYKALEDDGLLMFPYKSVWNPKIPQKVMFFVWTLCYNAAPTIDTYRNSTIVNGCLLYKKDAESNNHLFLHCETTRSVWHYFMNCYNVQWVFHDSVRSNIWEWRKKKCRNTSVRKRIWDIIPFAIWWAVWLERNSRVFTGKYRTANILVDSVKVLIFNWCVGTDIFQGYSLTTVLSNWEAVMR